MGIPGLSVDIFRIPVRGVYREGGGSWSSTHRQPQIWIQKIFSKKIYKNTYITLIINDLFNRERYRTGMYLG